MKRTTLNTKHWASVSALGLACGGRIEMEEDAAPVDATVHHPDAEARRDASNDSSDAGSDGPPDARCREAGCLPWVTLDHCIHGCPDGSVCIWHAGPLPEPYGCAGIPAECNGNPTCECMESCICPCYWPYQCDDRAGPGTITCDNGTISLRAAKTDIAYIEEADRRRLARQVLDVRLATYRYRTDETNDRRRLGFIIDDQPESSPAVQGDRTHVDLYGYASMLLATIQEQQAAIERLAERVRLLEGRAI